MEFRGQENSELEKRHPSIPVPEFRILASERRYLRNGTGSL
jgi:hypothetical protein